MNLMVVLSLFLSFSYEFFIYSIRLSSLSLSSLYEFFTRSIRFSTIALSFSYSYEFIRLDLVQVLSLSLFFIRILYSIRLSATSLSLFLVRILYSFYRLDESIMIDESWLILDRRAAISPSLLLLPLNRTILNFSQATREEGRGRWVYPQNNNPLDATHPSIWFTSP